MTNAALKLKPQGELLSITQVAKRCKLDRATCRNRLDDLGYEADPTSTEKNQLYWFDDEVEFAIKSAKDAASAFKIRGMRAVAETKEFDLAVKRGDYVLMVEAVELVRRVVGTLYQEATVRQPKRIAANLAKAKNVTAVKKILKTDNDRIMKSLRENFERFID